MKKVTGIGGIFFKSKDPQQLKEWYKLHLGIESESWGSQFFWKDDTGIAEHQYTAFSPFKADTTYFAPSTQSFMINFRVDDLFALLDELKKSGIESTAEPQDGEYGKFAWIMDPDGNKLELWEAPKK